MTNWFTNPALLWSALLIIPLLLLFMLRHRPIRKRVSSILLWQGVAQMQVATSPFQRLKRSTSLLLLIAALALLVFALSGFRVPDAQETGTSTIVVIDISASMGATSGSRTTLQQAVALLPSLQEDAHLKIERYLVWDGQLTEVTASQTAELSARDYGASSQSLRLTLKALAQENTGRQVILLTDHSVGEVEGISVLVVGEQTVNTAITAASTSEVSPSQTDLFFGVELFNADNFETTLLLERQVNQGFKLIDARKLRLKRGKRTPYSFQNAKPGLYRATLKLEDSFALDNTAWIRVASLPKLDVVVHGEPGVAVVRALHAIEQTMGLLRVVESADPSRSATTTHLFADSLISGTQAALPSAYFAPHSLPPGVKLGNPVDASTQHAQRHDHWLWRGVGATDLQVTQVFSISTDRWTEPLLSAGENPTVVLITREDSNLKDLLFMTPLDDTATGFTETVAFLVFWANWYDRIRRSTDPLPNGAVRTRSSFSIWAPGMTGNIEVKHQDTDDADSLAPSQLFTAERAGAYKCSGTNEFTVSSFGASLLDPTESSLSQSDENNNAEVIEGLAQLDSSGRGDIELAPWLAMAACCIFLLEWILYRRKFLATSMSPTSATPPHKKKVTA